MLKCFFFLKVGLMIILEYVECCSNYLMWFGSCVFVFFNKFDLDIIVSRILDFLNYVLVFFVFCVMFGLYFLVVIWVCC